MVPADPDPADKNPIIVEHDENHTKICAHPGSSSSGYVEKNKVHSAGAKWCDYVSKKKTRSAVLRRSHSRSDFETKSILSRTSEIDDLYVFFPCS